MNVSNVSTEVNQYNSTAKTDSSSKGKTNENTANTTEKKDSNPAAVYTPSTETETTTDSTKQLYKPDTDLVNKLKADADQRMAQLKSLVEKLISKQGDTYNCANSDSTNIFQALREGKLKVDPKTVEQAKQDISEDGYWGVKQTSQRIYDFAIALTGGDPSKADAMLKAVEKGFKEAEKVWGGKLPEICQKTLEAVKEKFSEWKNKNNAETASSGTETTK